MGRTEEAASTAGEQALSIAQAAGDGWNRGYALGTQAAIAAASRPSKLREAELLADAHSVGVMRRIGSAMGVARALLGLGDLARFRGHPGEAHSRYVEALAILQEVARPRRSRAALAWPSAGWPWTWARSSRRGGT